MRWAILGVCLVTAACSDDPARSVKIVSRQPVPVTSVYTPPHGPDRNLIPDYCPPPQDSPGPGNFAATGPCEFQQHARVHCESTGDDLIVPISRKAKNGATLVIYLNVEHYHGPGVYEDAQLFVAVESGTIIYRWSNDQVRAVVGPDETFVVLPKTSLDQEPMRMECSRLIGPESNYTYQCAASSGANIAFDSTAEIVAGKLQCGN